MASVEIAVTHEVVIRGDKSWVKVGISEEVGKDETTDDVIKRVSDKVNQKVIEVIEDTVNTVQGYNN